MFYPKMTEDEERVFLKLQKQGPLTKKELEDSLGFKPSTLGRILVKLIEYGLIEETIRQDAGIGRKPYCFDINTKGRYLLGLDICRTRLTAVLCNLKLEVIDSIDDDASIVSLSPSRMVVEEVCQLALELIKRNGIDIAQVLGAGVAMVGPVERHSGCTQRIVGFPTKDWNEVPLKAMIAEKLGCRVYVDNGSYCAVLYEYLYGVGRDYKRVAYLNCNFGIRAGYINSNVIIRAANNDESALSHTTIVPSGERCHCGKRGCVDCYSTTHAIFNSVRSWIRMGGETMIKLPPERIFFKEVVEAAQKGDSVCLREIRSAGELLGYAIANYITILNPELVILGGGAINLYDEYFNSVYNTVNANLSISGRMVTIHKGGSHAGKTMAVGAAAAFFEKSIGNPMMD